MIVVSGIRNLLKPGTIAWEDFRYEQLLKLLEDKLEIEERFDDLEERVKYVNDMLKFFLEEKEGHAMERLVVLVVIILVMELGISTFEFWRHHAKPTLASLQAKWSERELEAASSSHERA
jgi:uncharacterized Rmd1/YagE family protein